MRKRKPRIPCQVDGCETQIMYDRMLCQKCWMSLPSGVRKAHLKVWLELKPYVIRATNKLREYPREDAVHVLSLVNAHHASCDDCMTRANNIRMARHVAPDNAIKTELAEMGLL